MNTPNIAYLDPANAIEVARESTRRDLPDQAGLGQRWTELAVYYLLQPPTQYRGKRWLSFIEGHSTHEGEELRMRHKIASTLDSALTMFDDSFHGRMVKDEARRWAHDNSRSIVAHCAQDQVAAGVADQSGNRNDALRTAIEHIEHMAAWITAANRGETQGTYSFESLGEDMPGLKAALAGGFR